MNTTTKCRYVSRANYNLLELKPCTYEIPAGNGYAVKEFGFLLDDCVKHDVHEVVNLDAFGIATSVNQGSVGVLLVPIVRVYRDELIAAKSRISALETKVALLEEQLSRLMARPLDLPASSLPDLQ